MLAADFLEDESFFVVFFVAFEVDDDAKEVVGVADFDSGCLTGTDCFGLDCAGSNCSSVLICASGVISSASSKNPKLPFSSPNSSNSSSAKNPHALFLFDEDEETELPLLSLSDTEDVESF